MGLLCNINGDSLEKEGNRSARKKALPSFLPSERKFSPACPPQVNRGGGGLKGSSVSAPTRLGHTLGRTTTRSIQALPLD